MHEPQLQICPYVEQQNATEDDASSDSAGPECLWCGKGLRLGRGRSAGRFCCAAHRTAYWTACRRLGELALTCGIVSIADLKAGPAACTLPQRAKSPPSVPEAGLPSSAAPKAMARFFVEIEDAVIQRLVFRHFAICHHERDDLPTLMAALGRIGQKPKITETDHVRILSY